MGRIPRLTATKLLSSRVGVPPADTSGVSMAAAVFQTTEALSSSLLEVKKEKEKLINASKINKNSLDFQLRYKQQVNDIIKANQKTPEDIPELVLQAGNALSVEMLEDIDSGEVKQATAANNFGAIERFTLKSVDTKEQIETINAFSDEQDNAFSVVQTAAKALSIEDFNQTILAYTDGFDIRAQIIGVKNAKNLQTQTLNDSAINFVGSQILADPEKALQLFNDPQIGKLITDKEDRKALLKSIKSAFDPAKRKESLRLEFLQTEEASKVMRAFANDEVSFNQLSQIKKQAQQNGFSQDYIDTIDAVQRSLLKIPEVKASVQAQTSAKFALEYKRLGIDVNDNKADASPAEIMSFYRKMALAVEEGVLPKRTATKWMDDLLISVGQQLESKGVFGKKTGPFAAGVGATLRTGNLFSGILEGVGSAAFDQLQPSIARTFPYVFSPTLKTVIWTEEFFKAQQLKDPVLQTKMMSIAYENLDQIERKKGDISFTDFEKTMKEAARQTMFEQKPLMSLFEPGDIVPTVVGPLEVKGFTADGSLDFVVPDEFNEGKINEDGGDTGTQK